MTIAWGEHVPAVGDSGRVTGENGRQGLTGPHDVAGAGGDHEADGRIDGILDPIPPAAKTGNTASDRLGLNLRDHAVARRAVQLTFRRLRQQPGIVDDPRIAHLALR